MAEAGGWAHRIPADRIEAWEARRRDLLARIEDEAADAFTRLVHLHDMNGAPGEEGDAT